jgi:phosphoglucomutase/phosphomannomutase
MTSATFDLEQTLQLVETAVQENKVTASAGKNIRSWLVEPRYSAYAPAVANAIEQSEWQQLDDVFWTIIPFGTGGRRGRMHPFGSNAINDRTIGESAQGLADYVREVVSSADLACGIAYDTRHNSRHFAELCAGIMVANGFKVYFLDDYRSTPELSYLVRYKKCDCGIMVTASHNPPSDNAVKVYWSTGGQLVPPHDQAVVDRVAEVDQIKQSNFQQGVAAGKIELCTDELDRALLAEHQKQSFPGPRDLKILYSPLHGVGEFNVLAALQQAGFQQATVFELHRKPDGDFPNVPHHVSNPENAAVFDAMIVEANLHGNDLCLATDPDCDRMGAAARLVPNSDQWATFNGNQLCVLLGDFVIGKHKQAGTADSDSFVVTTLVTTKMLSSIAAGYGVRCLDRNLVGFKWIADVMDREGADKFLYGTEESHGFLVGQYVRDKDGAVACMLMAECAAELKAKNKTLHQRLDELYLQHGHHADYVLNVQMEGSDGMKKMKSLMGSLRTQAPEQLGGNKVVATEDYMNDVRKTAAGQQTPLNGPKGDMLIFELAATGWRVAIRPSGTEPKIKCYIFVYTSPEQISDLAQTKQTAQENIARLCTDLKQLAQ